MKLYLSKKDNLLAIISVCVIFFFLLVVDIYYTWQDNNMKLHHDAVYAEELTMHIILILLPVILVFYRLLLQINNQKQELIKNNQVIQGLASTDGLTGLLNHRSFQDKLSQEVTHSNNEKPLTLLMMDIDNFKIFNDQYGHQAGDAVLKQLSNLFIDFINEDGIVARYGGEEFVIILPNTDHNLGLEKANLLCELVKTNDFAISNTTNVNVSLSIGLASYPKDAVDRENLIRFADQALYSAKEKEVNKVQMYYSVLEELRDNLDIDKDLLNIIYTLNTIINTKDKYTYAHSERVLEYAVKLGQSIGLEDIELENLKFGALLHDIGKIETSGDILNKKDKLTFEEFENIKKHPLIGTEIVKPIKSLENALPFVLYHHERYDGKGYPYGLKGDEIPLPGRIAAVADSFDAMTTKRPYQKAKTICEALQELQNCSGKQFDPNLVLSFINLFPEIEMA